MRGPSARGGVNEARPSDGSIADDGTLVALPRGSDVVEVGAVDG